MEMLRKIPAMLVIGFGQIRIFREAATLAATAELCVALRVERGDRVDQIGGEAGDRFEERVGDRVAEALACGFASKADVRTYVEFALFDHPGFERSVEFRDFLAQPGGSGAGEHPQQRMLEFIRHAPIAFWRRYGGRCRLEKMGTPL